MKHKLIVGLLAVAVLAAGAQTPQRTAQKPREVSVSAKTGEDLVNQCKHADAENPDDQGAGCLMYIAGFRDGYGYSMVFFNNKKQSFFCPVDEVTLTQMAKVLVKYGGDHPQELWLSAPGLLFAALKDAYPCQE